MLQKRWKNPRTNSCHTYLAISFRKENSDMGFHEDLSHSILR